MMQVEEQGFRFLVASDVHLGHRERHPVRNRDSFQAFSEVLKIARQEDVDFLLLGGDLFDQVNPSKESLLDCLNILKRETFGSKEIRIFVTLNGEPYNANFTNENVNISLPIFTIHGNHDYPSNDFGKISVCDLLQSSNYVNYFGKHLNLKQMVVRPLIFHKKNCKTKLAIYGMGYIKDVALNGLFEANRITFELPVGNLEEYFCILILHQNRYKKGYRAGAPYSHSLDAQRIPEWMNLTIWGHEHEAIREVETQYSRPIYQPGSTILTSYIQAESSVKQCGLITVKHRNCKVDSKLMFDSYRAMYCINLQTAALIKEFGTNVNIPDYLTDLIEKILHDCEGKKKPIIRIKMEHTGSQDNNSIKLLEGKYRDKVANSEKIFVFWKRKVERESSKSQAEFIESMRTKQRAQDPNQDMKQVIEEYINSALKTKSISIFPVGIATEQISRAVNSESVSMNECIKEATKRWATKNIGSVDANLRRFLQLKQDEISATKSAYRERLREGRPLANQDVLTREKLAIFNRTMEDQIAKEHANLQTKNSQSKDGSSQKQARHSACKIEVSENVAARKSSIALNSLFAGNRQKAQSVDRSDSEDCCVRASKQVYDESGVNERYREAESYMERVSQQRRKKNEVMKPKGKAVRFSEEFL